VHVCAAVCLAAAPGATEVRSKWEAARVSGLVTSQVRHRVRDQVIKVTPSIRVKPLDSLAAGILAVINPRQMMSLSRL